MTRGARKSPAPASPIGCSRRWRPRPAAKLANAAGTATDFAGAPCVEALRYWIDLSGEISAHPPGVVEWGTTPRDFLEQKAAMIWTTTGNLSNIRGNAKFPFGVAMLPADKRRGSPTGGGNFYLFKSATEAQRQACLRLLRWISSPERAAQWGIDTGYVATGRTRGKRRRCETTSPDFPAAAVARDQLQYAVAELSTHDNQRVTQALNDSLQAALTGEWRPKPRCNRRRPPRPDCCGRFNEYIEGGICHDPPPSSARRRGERSPHPPWFARRPCKS